MQQGPDSDGWTKEEKGVAEDEREFMARNQREGR